MIRGCDDQGVLQQAMLFKMLDRTGDMGVKPFNLDAVIGQISTDRIIVW